MYMCGCMHTMNGMCVEVEDNLWELVLSFYHMWALGLKLRSLGYGASMLTSTATSLARIKMFSKYISVNIR